MQDLDSALKTMTVPADEYGGMPLARRMRERLSREDGWSLVELLVVILVLGLVLGAVVQVSVTGQKAAARDRERNLTLEAGNTAAYRITNELRQATRIHLADTSCPTATSVPANCIDFDLPNRTVVSRDPTTGAVTGVSRTSRRVIFDCSTGACFRAASANTATAPSAANRQRFVTKVQNAGVTAPGGTIPPIFDYKAWSATPLPAGWKSTTLSFSSPSVSAPPPNWVNVTLRVARAGERQTANGLRGNIYLQDAADLKNMNLESSPCSPSSTPQTGC